MFVRGRKSNVTADSKALAGWGVTAAVLERPGITPTSQGALQNLIKENLKYKPGTVCLIFSFVGFVLVFFPCKFVELKYIFNCLTA